MRKPKGKSRMSWWVENQLKAALLTDLKPIIPEGYFELESNKLQLDASLDKTGYLSKELSWGTAAHKFGHNTHFKSTAIITPRQLSAAEVLMNIGMLVAARASQQACSNVKVRADSLKVFDGNAEKVALQIKEEQIPQFELNVRGALTQYLRHLSKEEAAPYLSMLKMEDLIELGLKVRMRDKVLSLVAKNLEVIVVAVVTALTIAMLLFLLGIPN
jgi:hypothetical protein